jgi:cytochrome c oxidase cbb3-type subunit III
MARASGRFVLFVPLVCFVMSCDREDRRFTEAPPAGAPGSVVRQSPLQPGPVVVTEVRANPYDENAYALSQGQRLYGWFNCAGCHANGGGGMGPPLMDDEWIYGSDPDQIYRTITEGRPNGMPSWAGRIPDTQIWQIIAYVRSMSGLVPPNVRNSRADHMMTFPESMIQEERAKPRQQFLPPASRSP